MTGPITRHRDIESLKTAARWPGADRATAVILAARLAAARADAEGYRYFAELAGARPGEALPLALAGFFQARLGEDADAALARLDQAAATDLGQDRVKAALGDLDPPADGAISHLILTHAHWDHIGGAAALRGPGTRVIAQAGFPAGLDRQQGDRPRFRYFTGAAGRRPPGRHPRPADQPADAADRRGHRACPVPDAGRGNPRRADGPPSGQRRAVHRRRADALPGTALRRRRLPGRTPGRPSPSSPACGPACSSTATPRSPSSSPPRRSPASRPR